MEHYALVAIAGFALIFGLYSRRVEGGDLSPTLLFTLAGLLAGPAVAGVLEVEVETLRTLGEWTLILLLFTDASRINLRSLRRELGMPVRLLAIGMPLTIVTGTALALLLLPSLSIWEAALLASVLAPTDAALGQAVVSSPAVPLRIRQALNVESGLNDGIALPFVMVFAALAGQTVETGGSGGSGESAESGLHWLIFWAQQVGVGVLAGAVVGGLGGRWLRVRDAAEEISPSFERVGAIAVAVLAVAVAELGGGNAFIAAFVGGMALGNTAPTYAKCVHEFLEAEGQLLMLVIFMFVGAVLAWPAISAAKPALVLYALASLTVARMLPVGVSLLGTQSQRSTALFVGWFGPRGLASVLFGLLIVEGHHLPHEAIIFETVICTVVLSIVLHGITARRGALAYGRAMADCEAGMEHEAVDEHRARAGSTSWEG